MSFLRVALDVPLPTLFDYRAGGVGSRDIGARVVVPFGRKIAVGIVMEIADATSLPPERVRTIIEIPRDAPPLPPDVLELLKFCSDYYFHPIGEVVLNALPRRLRQRRSSRTREAAGVYRLTAAGRAVNPASLPRRATIKLELLRRLRASDDGVDVAALSEISPRAAAALKTMVALEWVERVAPPLTPSRTSDAAPLTGPLPVLTTEQQAAVDRANRAGAGFAPWLLHGVTGSGKTEVYLRLVSQALRRQQQSLLLVPEINLTPQLEALVRTRFPDTPTAMLHSGLNESERLHNWLDAGSGAAGIVLGTRLAVFAPMPRLGLIIVDEEQDESYKQTDGLTYSARDLALWRAKQHAIPIVLGSATPALESFSKALAGDYRTLTLRHRVNAEPPLIECVDTRRETLVDGLSQTLLHALRTALKDGMQSLVFINRRGFAPVLICSACGWASGCERCAATLVLHMADARLRCHHCGHQERIPGACPQCGDQQLKPLGQGTQRVERALARFFPAAEILRIDSDSTRRKHAWHEMRRRIHAREIDILVGTQILAKGHDFPQLNLVGVLNADSSLYSSDFRAAERLFARLTQVAGRAGRGATQGRVLIQTEFPEHALFQALRRGDYPAFARTLLAERKEVGLPPFVYQAVLRAEASRAEAALDFLRDAAREGAHLGSAVTIYDPVPASMPRRAGLERAQLMVQSRSRPALHAFLRRWHAKLRSSAGGRVRWVLDIDPLVV